MSNSERLRQTAASIGGGRGIFNEDALYHEVGLREAIPEVILILKNEYPNAEFLWKKRITKREIAAKVNPKVPYNPEVENSFVNPDGGVLFVKYEGEEYPCEYLPILISEAKKQGTNVKRLSEGLKKQSKGNAIERAFKNIDEFKLYCEDLNYFPYVIFACGCDFERGSSILDRLDAMTRYEPRNVNYVADSKQKVTIYIQEDYFAANEMFEKIYEVATTSLKCIGV